MPAIIETTHRQGNRGKLSTWLAITAIALGVAIAIALGFWQLGRAAQKNAWVAQQQTGAQAAPWDATALANALSEEAAPYDAMLHRRVQLQGRWLAQHTVYLDNRQMQGKPGFYVLTPLQLSNGGVIVVQRGWVARNFVQRQTVAGVTTPSDVVVIEGQLAAAPSRLFALGEGDGIDAAHPHIRQNLSLSRWSDETGLSLWPVTVMQTSAASEGLLREWPQVSYKVATHYGYAAQWFAIAAVLAGMLLWFFVIPMTRLFCQRHVSPQS